MAKNILITGGTGLVGTRLTEILLAKGYSVSYLSRSKKSIPNVSVHKWNLETGYIDAEAIQNADFIIHLAGAGIADSRWTDARKKKIIDSRVLPLELLSEAIKKQKNQVEALISASAIGYYGGERGEEKLDENAKAGKDFLADCTVKWENAIDDFATKTGLRAAKIRIGVVLSDKGGALEKMVIPFKLGVGSPIGTGQQWISWIHVDDLCQIFIAAIENKQMSGIINAVSDEPVRNYALSKAIATTLNMPFWAPNVPAFSIKLLMGEMATIVLGSAFVKNTRLKNEFKFPYQFPTIEKALKAIYSK